MARERHGQVVSVGRVDGGLRRACATPVSGAPSTRSSRSAARRWRDQAGDDAGAAPRPGGADPAGPAPPRPLRHPRRSVRELDHAAARPGRRDRTGTGGDRARRTRPLRSGARRATRSTSGSASRVAWSCCHSSATARPGSTTSFAALLGDLVVDLSGEPLIGGASADSDSCTITRLPRSHRRYIHAQLTSTRTRLRNPMR